MAAGNDDRGRLVTLAGYADRIRALPRAERLALYRSLPPGLLASQRYSPEFWARPTQALPPPGDLARVELVIGGFGAGKTQWATWLFLREWLAGRARRPCLVASTLADVLPTLIDGPSGIRTWLPWQFDRWRSPSAGAFVQGKGRGTFTLPGLPPIVIATADNPASVTGHGKDLSLFDDPAKAVESLGEEKVKRTFRNLRISTREGPRPCVIVPTTLDGMGFMRRALAGNMVGVRKRNLGSAKDNTALARDYVEQVIEDLLSEGETSDLDGIEREDNPGALWRRRWIASGRVQCAPQLVRVVVAVDPADDGKADSDETGIVVVGLGEDGRLYVLADYTARWTAALWPAITAWAFAEHKCDAIVAETNRAASLVRRCLAIEAPNVPIVEVQASRGKATRAEPLALQTRDGLVSFVVDGPQVCRPGHRWIRVPVFDPATGQREVQEVEVKRDRRGWETLEDELCGWDPRKRRSPNGLDALVWGSWHLKPPEAAPEETEEILSAPGRYAQGPSPFAPGRFAGSFGRRR